MQIIKRYQVLNIKFYSFNLIKIFGEFYEK